MQHCKSLLIDMELINAIQNNVEDKNEVILKHIDEDNIQILNLLNCYDFFDGTEGLVHNYLIDEESIEIDNDGNGMFSIDFIAHHYYGCAELNRERENHMNLTTNINFKTKEMVITGEFWDERQDEDY